MTENLDDPTGEIANGPAPAEPTDALADELITPEDEEMSVKLMTALCRVFAAQGFNTSGIELDCAKGAFARHRLAALRAPAQVDLREQAAKIAEAAQFYEGSDHPVCAGIARDIRALPAPAPAQVEGDLLNDLISAGKPVADAIQFFRRLDHPNAERWHSRMKRSYALLDKIAGALTRPAAAPYDEAARLLKARLDALENSLHPTSNDITMLLKAAILADERIAAIEQQLANNAKDQGHEQ